MVFGDGSETTSGQREKERDCGSRGERREKGSSKGLDSDSPDSGERRGGIQPWKGGGMKRKKKEGKKETSWVGFVGGSGGGAVFVAQDEEGE